jgi:hypothetical protein
VELDLSTLEVKVIQLTNATVDPKIALLIEERNQRKEIFDLYARRVEFLEREVFRSKETIDAVRLEIKQAKQRRFNLKGRLHADRREENRFEYFST